MTERLVLDASAGVELVLNTEAGTALRARLPTAAEEWVPELYFVEVAAVLRRAEIAGRLTRERAAVAFDRLLTTPVRRVETKPLLAEAWTLRHNLTVADAGIRGARAPPRRDAGDRRSQARTRSRPPGGDHQHSEIAVNR